MFDPIDGIWINPFKLVFFLRMERFHFQLSMKISKLLEDRRLAEFAKKSKVVEFWKVID